MHSMMLLELELCLIVFEKHIGLLGLGVGGGSMDGYVEFYLYVPGRRFMDRVSLGNGQLASFGHTAQ